MMSIFVEIFSLLPGKGINLSIEFVLRLRCSQFFNELSELSMLTMGGLWPYSLTSLASSALDWCLASHAFIALLHVVMIKVAMTDSQITRDSQNGLKHHLWLGYELLRVLV